MSARKQMTTELFLCFFFGMLGLHRLYKGKLKTGLLMLVTFGGLGLWYVIDLGCILKRKWTYVEQGS